MWQSFTFEHDMITINHTRCTGLKNIYINGSLYKSIPYKFFTYERSYYIYSNGIEYTLKITPHWFSSTYKCVGSDFYSQRNMDGGVKAPLIMRV